MGADAEMKTGPDLKDETFEQAQSRRFAPQMQESTTQALEEIAEFLPPRPEYYSEEAISGFRAVVLSCDTTARQRDSADSADPA
jgi:hypothetical protein